MTERDANERMALLLGWEQRKDMWKLRATGPVAWQFGPPDYTSWERFPEMQEYVRKLPGRELGAVMEHASLELTEGATTDPYPVTVLMGITPTILRDAILACTDDVP